MEIYTSNRLENLLDVLAEELSSEKCDAGSLFSRPRDIVVIQSLGMAKWLQQNLAEKNGIAAHIEFPFLKNFINDILVAYGYSRKENTWDRETLCWRIYKLLAEFEEHFEVLAKYVAGEQRRRYQLAEKLGSLYDQYMVYRWDWIESWTHGQKAKVKPGDFEFLDSSHEEWQMKLWQELCKQSADSFQHSLLDFVSKQNFSREQLGLSEKISIFGVTNMPTVFIDFFEALSTVCEVHFFYLNPCAEYWGDISMKKSLFVRHNKDDFPHSPNSLLKSWGLLGRDFLNQLLDRTEFNVCELFQDPEGHSALHEIQKSILNMHETFAPTDLFDESIQINACHNPRRELEVLHDYLLKVLQVNKHIEPRDIIVMAPDIQDYSPHIRNVFDRENRLPFSISDQDISTSPLISTYKNILQLYRSRLSGNDILEIIEHPDVLKKFSLKPDDIPQLREWIKEAAICWGKDAQYREELGLPAFEQNSWKFGFDRLLAGYAFSDELLYENSVAVPVGENGLTLGKFKAAVDCFFDIQASLKSLHSPQVWCQFLQNVLRDSFIEDNENSNEHNFITQSISRLEEQWRLADIDEELPADIVIKAFFALIDESSSSYGFLDNGITFCSLLPMRSIPAKVVCMLGIDEGVYPRSDRETGFDLMSLHWRQGDRTKRLDDRYLFLESLLSARDYFYVSFRGMDENENTRIPPSIVLSEFIEFLEESCSPCRVAYHPLHSFSSRYFDLKDPDLYSYSRQNYKSALAHSKKNMEKKSFCSEDLDFAEGFIDDGWIHLTLKDLADFIKHPARQFLKHQLGAALWQENLNELPDTEPFDSINSLDAYNLRTSITEKLLDRASEIESDELAVELKDYYLAKGELRLGKEGAAEFDKLYVECRDLAAQLTDLQVDYTEETIEVDLAFPEYNVRLTGEVDRIFGSHFIPYHVGSNKFKHKFKHTISYLALLSQGTYHLHYCVKGEKSPQMPGRVLDSEKAVLYLSELVEFYLLGMHKPLPFFSDCFDDYLKAKNPDALLRKKWYPDPFSFSPPLGEDEANVVCFGQDFPGDNPELADTITGVFEFFKDMYTNIWEGTHE